MFKYLLGIFALCFPIAAVSQPPTVLTADAVAQAAAQFFVDACILHGATLDQFQQWGNENHLVHPAHVSYGIDARDTFENPSHFAALFISRTDCFVKIPRANNRYVAEYIVYDLGKMHARFSPIEHIAPLGENFYDAGELVHIGPKMWDLIMSGGDDDELPDAVPEILKLGISAFLDKGSKP